MVGVTGVEPVTSSLSGMRSNQLSYTPNGISNFEFQISSIEVSFTILHSYSPFVIHQFSEKIGGGKRDRTDDLLNANQALSQLSYTPRLVLFLLNDS